MVAIRLAAVVVAGELRGALAQTPHYVADFDFGPEFAEYDTEYVQEYDLTGAEAEAAFLQTQSQSQARSQTQMRQNYGDNMECSCEVLRCNCGKACDCGEAFVGTKEIRIDGGCWCNKMNCECQKRCDCVPTDTLPPKPPPPKPPSPPPPPEPSPPPPPPAPPFDPCACANNFAGVGLGRGDGGGEGVSNERHSPDVQTNRPACGNHVRDGIYYCYVVEPSQCSNSEMIMSIKFPGAKWLACDQSTNYPWPEGHPAHQKARDTEKESSSSKGLPWQTR